ncbi:hypothetical protein [Teredinibacter haidensis]|uniref:hypothetical protein n=1 Tax=Teredinibacter haidensis TaxID=2731755 RepID=UPI000948BD4E|nr:hypothetical protein [Teredinibacter haidensis]
MKKIVLITAALVFSTAVKAETDLGLDAACNYNGTAITADYSWQGSEYVYCQLPAFIAVNDEVKLAVDNADDQPILWVMDGVVTVGNGYVEGANPATVDKTELTIKAGARLAGASLRSALVISRGASIYASGRSTRPIIFSSLDDNFTGKGEWAGVVLAGFGESNDCGEEECVIKTIGSGSYYYGGSNTQLSSGQMKYVVIAEAGSVTPNYPLGRGLQLNNGLSLYAVGSSTNITDIHIQGSLGDGVEFFGGDVRLNKAWLSCNLDDSVAWRYGYTGLVQNVNITQQFVADSAFDLANNIRDNGATPESNGTVDSASIRFVDGLYVSEPLNLKYGTDGTFTNMVISGYAWQRCTKEGSHLVESGDFSTISYDCVNDNGLLPPSDSTAVGFSTDSFWTTEQGNPGC